MASNCFILFNRPHLGQTLRCGGYSGGWTQDAHIQVGERHTETELYVKAHSDEMCLTHAVDAR